MRFGCKVNNTIKQVYIKKGYNRFLVCYIGFFKNIILFFLNIPEILKITGISELGSVDNPVIRIIDDKPSDNMRSDESCSAGDQYNSFEFHDYTFLFLMLFSQIQAVLIASSRELRVFQPSSLLASAGSAQIFSISPALLPVILYFSFIPETFSKDLIASNTETPFPVPRLKTS